jgi:hypothetical protein
MQRGLISPLHCLLQNPCFPTAQRRVIELTALELHLVALKDVCGTCVMVLAAEPDLFVSFSPAIAQFRAQQG